MVTFIHANIKKPVKFLDSSFVSSTHRQKELSWLDSTFLARAWSQDANSLSLSFTSEFTLSFMERERIHLLGLRTGLFDGTPHGLTD